MSQTRVCARRAVTCGLAVALAGCSSGSFSDVEESVLGADERGEIVGTYDRGVERLNEGTEARDDGIVAFNEERYSDSVDSLETAVERYDEAAETFRSAGEMAEDAGVPPAAGICTEAATHAETMEESTVEARAGAAAAESGDSAGAINERIEASRELRDEAENSEVADSETLLDTLEASE